MANLIKKEHTSLMLTLMLFALLVLYPLISMHLTWEALIDVFVLLILFYGVWIASNQKQHFFLALVIASTFVVTDWVATFTDNNILQVVSSLAGTLFFGFLGLLLLKNIYQQGSRVTVNMIYSSISIYLLIGLAFAFLYMAISILDPGAFTEAKFMGKGFQTELHGFIYFSFVTLSTLGFGDVSPNSVQIAAFVYMEAIIGQLYLTILVARLVGLHIAQGEPLSVSGEEK